MNMPYENKNLKLDKANVSLLILKNCSVRCIKLLDKEVCRTIRNLFIFSFIPKQLEIIIYFYYNAIIIESS